MHNWFECKIRYERLDESGKVKKVVEPYLVDALSFTEAEARLCKEMEPYISGEYTVANIRRVNIHEMFENENGDRWYRCKVNFVTLDEDKGIEKKTPTFNLVQANDIKEALESLLAGMKGIMADYEIVSIVESPIMDVFKYGVEKEVKDEDTDFES